MLSYFHIQQDVPSIKMTRSSTTTFWFWRDKFFFSFNSWDFLGDSFKIPFDTRKFFVIYCQLRFEHDGGISVESLEGAGNFSVKILKTNFMEILDILDLNGYLFCSSS